MSNCLILLASAVVATALSVSTAGPEQGRGADTSIRQPVGPHHPVAPDAPVSDTEQKHFATCVIVQSHTAAAIQTARDRAIKDAVGIVYLPPGVYLFKNESVNVSNVKNLTILGAGSKTHLKTDKSAPMFRLTKYKKVRFSRLKIEDRRNNLSRELLPERVEPEFHR